MIRVELYHDTVALQSYKRSTYKYRSEGLIHVHVHKRTDRYEDE